MEEIMKAKKSDLARLEEKYNKSGNQLVVLLAMKRNEEALKVSRQLPDDEALTHYLRAVCLNRLEQMSDAYDELTKAIQMDPSLKQVAHTDGDVNDLLLDSNDNN